MSIDFENDRMQSVEQIDSAKKLSDKIIELKDLEDEIANAEESIKKLKEKALQLSAFEIPTMMDEMQITKLKLRDGESVEVKKVYGAIYSKRSTGSSF
jgi:D-Tyr-tRNAtyr deacylase